MASKDTNLLPEETSNIGLDATELRVNFSDEEATSVGRSFEALPGGKYPCTITEWSMQRSTSDKHAGKPYWALRLRVNDGHKYENRYFFPNVMLFEGALYSLNQLATALDGTDPAWTAFAQAIRTKGEAVVPHGDTLVGKEVTAIVTKKVDKYKIEQGEWDPNSGDPKPMKNDVSGFLPIAAGQLASTSGNPLMP